jgi:hypothetical protein
MLSVLSCFEVRDPQLTGNEFWQQRFAEGGQRATLLDCNTGLNEERPDYFCEQFGNGPRCNNNAEM